MSVPVPAGRAPAVARAADAAPAAGAAALPDDPFAGDLAFAVGLAERAGRLVAARGGNVGPIDYKSARDIVTTVDRDAEALILRAIRRHRPGDGFLGEEGGATAGPDSGDIAVGRTWVADPVDGTVNYANGIPFYCVSLALVVDGRPVVGVVRDPLLRETYAATADGPALLDGRPIQASRKERLSDAVISLAIGGRAVVRRTRRVRLAVRARRSLGSAALALAYVANGRFDAYCQSTSLSAWDVAAAGLIAERSGALVTDMTGGPWFRIDAPARAMGVLAAPPAHHARLLELLRED